MAQKQLSMHIVLGGKVDNTVGEIGQALVNMGYQIDGISRKLIDFGKESLGVYKDFELSMTDAEIALAANFQGTENELKKQMEDLKAFATAYAASTIFHTNDVANVINQMIHGGWDAVSVMENMAAVGHLAELGGMDLSTALTLVLDTTKALGIKGGENIEEFVDMWAYAANTSSGNALQFGEALQMLGSVGLFTDNKAELLSLIALMHNFGVKGTQAATMLKTSMLRIIAPSQTAGKILEKLGASTEEINEIRQDDQLVADIEWLERNGFKAFDDSGNLLPMLTVYENLIGALGKIAGGQENILHNEKTLGILSNVFGMRGIIGISNITRGLEGAQTVYDNLMNDSAEGYGEWAAQKRMDTLYGSLELLGSKWERFQQATGEGLSGQTRDIADHLGTILDKLSQFGEKEGFSAGLDMAERLTGWLADLATQWEGLDDKSAAGLMGALGSLAATGPGLLAAGGALTFIGWAAGTHAGRIALAATAVLALTEALNAMEKVDYESKFGDLGLDVPALNAYIQTLGGDFKEAYKNVADFRDALGGAIENYNKASQTFSSNLITDLVTNKTWTEKDLESYKTLGADMVANVLAGVKTSSDLANEYWKVFLTGDGKMSETAADPIYQSVMTVLQSEYVETAAQLEGIGQGLTDALMTAFNEGLTPENVAAIQAYFDELNEVMAREEKAAQSRQQEIQRQVMFHKAQTLDYSEVMDYVEKTILPQRQTQLDTAHDEFWSNYYYALSAYDRQIEKAGTPEEKQRLQTERDAFAARGEADYQKEQARIYAEYDNPILQLMQQTIGPSEYGDVVSYVTRLGSLVQSGFMDSGTAAYLLENSEYQQYAGNGNTRLAKFYADFINKLGGEEEIARRIGVYEQSGNEAMAAQLESLITTYRLLSTGSFGLKGEEQATEGNMTANRAANTVAALELMDVRGISEFYAALESGATEQEVSRAYNQIPGEIRAQLNRMNEALAATYDLEAAASGSDLPQSNPYASYFSHFAAWQLMNMTEAQAEAYRWKKEEGNEGNIDDTLAQLAAAKARLAEDQRKVEQYEQLNEYRLNPGTWDRLTGDYKLQMYKWEELNAEMPGIKLDMEDAQRQIDELQARLDEIMPEAEVNITDVDSAAEEAAGQIGGILSPQEVEAIFPDAEANARAARNTMESFFGTPIVQRIVTQFGNWFGGLEGKANGGRADRPVVFGEAGAEWFIPERHTPQTARLILQSANASGFTLADLAEIAGATMFAEGGTTSDNAGGSLSSASIWGDTSSSASYASSDSGGGGDSGGIVVQYSPVIHADNAEGVDRALRNDKERLRRMLEDLLEERELYGSVVKYQ